MRRAELKRRSAMRQRRRKRPMVDSVQSAAWHAAVTAGPCVMCVAQPPGTALFVARRPDFQRLEAHHIIPQQLLRRERLEHLLWIKANGLCVCRFHHGQHEAFAQRVPRRLLPKDAFVFAAELGLEWLLERDYPDDAGEDDGPRGMAA